MRIIAGKSKGVVLKTPDGLSTRPTADRVKEALFSIIQFEVLGTVVLDLFAGSGQLGIEALSRGAAEAVFIDHSKEACKFIHDNLAKAKLQDQATVIHGEYTDFLRRNRKKFGIVFLDPPYAGDFLENSLKIIAEIDILQSGGIIVTERPAEKDLAVEISGFTRSRDYKYGKTLLTVFRKERS